MSKVLFVTTAALLTLLSRVALSEGTLTEGYLAGEWCYVEQENQYAASERMNVNYRFEEGGTYITGQASDRRQYDGTYTIFDDGRIKLSAIPLKLRPESVQPEGFTLLLTGQQKMIFSRGFCPT